ncbi:protein kinase [Frateuria sp. Soil773]|uniref:bifunctional serine/threonine-protein kinase/formylglycine-generating enzyme family protein n=1 Tax=Frateuria sp. Soil773 TaxID=1736407 RepID=UPI0007000A63|nr:bifunctional serine/threonine-protein kinase/formylglycine-generating enzyme family protein [Frateuria sp. Soil773]KRE88291.1 protein kinase [Frateuria sp. Soil773]
MKSLPELIAALRADELKLLALFRLLDARGAVPEAVHRAELGLLERMGTDGGLDPAVAGALAGKLRALQAQAEPAEPAEPIEPVEQIEQIEPSHPPEPPSDVTLVQPARPPVAAPPVDDDATVVKPASRPPVPDEATVVKPASQPPRADGPPVGFTGTRSGGSFNTESWQRVSDAEGGDHATVGSLLKGRFHLEREIGRGGMGVVFLARDERKVEARDRDPYVAVKVLNDEFRRHPDSLIALQRESRRSQQLAHDNIVRVFDFDKDGTIVFMTMEYIDGSDLKTLIRERAYNGLPLAEVRPLIEGMAWALKRAHAAGVVHSDFKPGNVMVTRDGVPKVFDFGIARAGKHMGDAVGEQTVFDAGTLGALTPAYASLEMIQGREPAPSDDIYALGCVAFELLTGKHPFDKVSAEVAMKEGRRPPPVPGLTRRQYQALCDSVAFTGDKRLKSAAELVEGLREVSLCQRFGPAMIYGAVAAVALAAGGWGLNHYLHARRVEQVVARFAPADPRHYASEEQAADALDSLGENERKRIVLDQGDLIEGFLLGRIDAYWNPDQNRYDYAKAQRVFRLRDRLKLYSPKLDLRRSTMDSEKNALLNALDTQLARQVDDGAIFEDQPDNVVATLAKIRAIDPSSSLLKDAELELKYEAAIGQSLDAGRIDEAGKRLELASRLFPGSPRLQQRKAQLDALAAKAAHGHAVAQAAAGMSLPEARKALAALAAHPAATAEWQDAAAAALDALHGDTSAPTRQLVDALADGIAGVAAAQNDPLQLAPTSTLVDFGLRYAPQSARLREQRGRLDARERELQARLDQESADAEVAGRIESMKRAAAADDVAKAQESLARIRALRPDHPFLAAQGPQLLADAYLGLARDTFRHGKYQGAAAVLARGIAALGDRADLREAKARYDFVAAAAKARGQRVPGAELERLRRQFDALRGADAGAMEQIEADMKLRGQLAEGSLAGLLDRLKSGGAAAANAPAAPAEAASPAGGAAPSAGTAIRPGAATTSKPAANAPATPAPQAAQAPQASQAAASGGADPCGKPELVGKGRACFDSLGNGRGPALVVVPGAAGGRPYALARAEITVNEFNRFCAATGQCKALAVADRDAGSLPVSNIGVTQAKAYAAWLSSASGYVYRLPTDAEWTHAAQAGGGWKQAPDSNCIPPSAGGDDGGGAPIPARGRSPNPWGLVNMTGNVWEWVTNGGGVRVRGGSYGSYWSDCNVDSRRDDSGAAQKDVGFRVLRELK